MVNSIRSHLKDQSAKFYLAIAVIVAFMAPVLVQVFSKTGASGQLPVATINGYDISASEFNREYIQNHQLKEQIVQQFGPYAEMLLQHYGLSGDIKNSTLNRLVQDKLFKSLVDKIGLVVGNDYLEAKLVDPLFIKSHLGHIIPQAALTSEGTINLDILSRFLKERDISPDQFDNIIKNSLEKELILDFINQSAYIPQEVLNELYIKQEVPRTYNIINFKLADYENKLKKGQISPEVLTGYYEQAGNKYDVPEKRSAFLWEFSPENFDIAVSDTDIEGYYNKNKDNFKDAQQQQKPLENVKQEIKNILLQERFLKRFNMQAGRAITQAKENSHMLKSFISEKKALKKDINDIAKDGSLLSQKLFNIKSLGSKIFYTQDNKGYILELVNIVPAYKPSFKDVESKVKEDYIHFQAQEALENDLKTSYQYILDNKDRSAAFAKIAQDFNTSVETVALDPKNSDQIEDFTKKSIPVHPMLNMAYVDMVSYAGGDNSGSLIMLKKLDTNVDQESINSKKAELVGSAKSFIDNVIYQLFVDNLRKNATIKYNI